MLTRRSWLRQSILTSAGAALLAPNTLQALSSHNINGVRISLAIYCTKTDVENLAQALGA